MLRNRHLPVTVRAKQPEVLLEMFGRASKAASALANAVARSKARFEQFITAENLIAALPLAADEFAVARSRLQNALRYYDGGEMGAASYELRLIERSLRQP